MKSLIVEDDFTSRFVLQEFLAPYGQTHIAVNGKEPMEAVGISAKENKPYDLICLDIMMPEMDGHAVLKAIRIIEEEKGIFLEHGVKRKDHYDHCAWGQGSCF